MREELLAAYEKIREKDRKAPVWAVRSKAEPFEAVHCAVPFVGKHYSAHKPRILLYASAENLSGYDGYLDDPAVADDRHRGWFDAWDHRGFYPPVHIRPVDDGGLLLAAYYIASQISQDVPAYSSPEDFMEDIAIANYGKFSIEGKTNKDYASSKDLLSASHEYIKADFEILKPDIVIIPKTIYKTDWDFIHKTAGQASDEITFYPIMQINCRTINTHIAKRHEPKSMGMLNNTCQDWYKHLHGGGFSGKTLENYKSVFSYLDDIIYEVRSGETD